MLRLILGLKCRSNEKRDFFAKNAWDQGRNIVKSA